MIFDVQRKLTDLNKRVFDLENLLTGRPVPLTVYEFLGGWLPWTPPPETPHALGGPRHTGVGDGLERDGTDLRVDEDASFSWTGAHVFDQAIYVADDTNTASRFGRAAIGWCGYNDVASFAHLDQNSPANAALRQAHLGGTYLNAATGQVLYLMIGGSQRVAIEGDAVIFNDVGLDVDFRAEAIGEAYALFIQGSDGKIGIRASTLNARVEIGGTPGPAILNLPTNLSTIDAGLSSRNVANESIVVFGTNIHTSYTGRTVVAEAGALIRCDTRDQDGGTGGGDRYTVFQVLTRAAGVAINSYTVPFQIAAGAPSASLWVKRTGVVSVRNLAGTGTRNVSADASGNLVIA